MTTVINGDLLCSVWYRFGFLGLFYDTSPVRDGGDHENCRHMQPVKLSECVTFRGAEHDCQPKR
jgi:hypothetical protein